VGRARSRCPHAYAYFIVSLSTRRAVALSCGSWACDQCGYRKKLAAQLMVEDGVRGAWERGERVRFMTLTSPDTEGLTMRELYEAFSKLRVKLRRSGHLQEYFAVVETTAAGALHLHVILTGRYLPQRRLSELAAWAGFGRVADIRVIKDDGAVHVSDYLVKSLAHYATKANVSRLAAKGARRLRPVRTSRAWFPGGMAEAEREVGRRLAEEFGKSSDLGPWVFVVKDGNGDLHVQQRGAPLVPLTTVPGAAQPPDGAATRTGGRGRAASTGPWPVRNPTTTGATP